MSDMLARALGRGGDAPPALVEPTFPRVADTAIVRPGDTLFVAIDTDLAADPVEVGRFRASLMEAVPAGVEVLVVTARALVVHRGPIGEVRS